MSAPATQYYCKQHPDRPAGVNCQRCGEPMCPSCMHQASVGWHCPTCVRSHTKQARPATRAVQVALHGHRPVLTMAFIAISALIYVWDITQGANPVSGAFSEAGGQFNLNAISVQFGDEWYRVVTSAFTHSGLIHIGFNMWLLWVLGQSLEGRFGSLTFLAMYATGILGGAVGAMLIEPRSAVVGASGAVFALMGVLLVLQRMGGLNVFQSGIGGLVLINVLLSFRGGISLGGHLGGLAAGLAMGVILGQARARGPKAVALAPVAIAVLGVALLLIFVPVVDRASQQFF